MSRTGVDHPDVIDLVTQEPNGEWALILVEHGAWDGSQDRLLKLQDKLNNYLRFALDGQMRRVCPASEGKRIWIRLDLYSEPDEKALRFIERAREAVKQEGLDLASSIFRPGHA